MAAAFLIFLSVVTFVAQKQDEGKLHAAFRTEGVRFHNSCPNFQFKSVLDCAQFLVTDHPLHITGGSIAPQNGFGAGGAFAFQRNYGPVRTSWNADAVASSNLSWRAGLYFKAVPTSETQTHTQVFPIFNLYAQGISLNTLTFFGLGPATERTARSFFGMTEFIGGGNAIVPIFRKIGLSLYGEINDRNVNIRGDHGQSSPSIEQVYDEATAPGLTHQPNFVQFGEGARLRHPFFTDHIQLDYLVTFQQFVAPGTSSNSFRRFTSDLAHEFPIFGHSTAPRTSDRQGPNECKTELQDTTDVADRNANCPRISVSRNLAGALGIRLFISESTAPAGHVVPFYFQPTLGGSDVNGNPSLNSFQDYRFRAPNVLLLRASYDQSIYDPFGITFMVDEGKVALTRDDIGFNHLAHSYTIGLTIRAGGFPQVALLYSWGGHEGTHTTASVNTSLLGGSTRPSLF
jgi:hypothetical protein